MQNTTPYRPLDDAARHMLHGLLGSPHAALSYIDHVTGTPGISRIAMGRNPNGGFLTLVSMLAAHGPSLRQNGTCAFMMGDVGEKGDPLTHPRVMIRARAQAIDPQHRSDFRQEWLKDHPKAALYIDLPDFHFQQLQPISAVLNAGFGRAYQLAPEDLEPRP